MSSYFVPHEQRRLLIKSCHLLVNCLFCSPATSSRAEERNRQVMHNKPYIHTMSTKRAPRAVSATSHPTTNSSYRQQKTAPILPTTTLRTETTRQAGRLREKVTTPFRHRLASPSRVSRAPVGLLETNSGPRPRRGPSCTRCVASSNPCHGAESTTAREDEQ